MIKINLLGMESFEDDSKGIIIAAYFGSLIFASFICIGLFYYTAAQVDSLTTATDRLQTELSRLQETTKEVRDLEKKKADLADKLSVIETLKRNKVGPVRILDNLNLALPDRAWISEVKETGGLMRIAGFALDNQTISSFMRGLENSEYFPQVDLVEATQTEKQGVKINSFVIQARLSYSGRIKVEAAAASTNPNSADGARGPAKGGTQVPAKDEE